MIDRYINERILLIDELLETHHLFYWKNKAWARDKIVNFYIPLSFIVFGLIVSAFAAYGSAWFLEKIRSTGLLIVCISPMLLVMSKYQIERILLKHRAVVSAKNSYAETDEVYLLQGRELVLFMKKVLSLWHYLPLAAVSFYAAFCFVADEKISREFNIITMIVWFLYLLYYFNCFINLRKICCKFEQCLN